MYVSCGGNVVFSRRGKNAKIIVFCLDESQASLSRLLREYRGRIREGFFAQSSTGENHSIASFFSSHLFLHTRVAVFLCRWKDSLSVLFFRGRLGLRRRPLEHTRGQSLVTVFGSLDCPFIA